MDKLRDFYRKQNLWQKMFIFCYSLICLFVLFVILTPVSHDPDNYVFATDPDFREKTSEPILMWVVFVLIGVGVYFYIIPSGKVNLDRVKDEIADFLGYIFIVLLFFFVVFIGGRAYDNRQKAVDLWYETTISCEELFLESMVDLQCRDDANCRLSRDELKDSQDRILKMAKYCTSAE